jgi:2-methylcitrate dehydratase
VAGGGDEGDRTCVETREQAVHSLPYILAVALLDGCVTPGQYHADRIASADVRQAMARVTVRPNPAYSGEFPNEMPCRVRIALQDGRVLARESREFHGFYTQPVAWDDAVRKFEALAEPYTTSALRSAIAGAVLELETIRVSELMRLLAEVRA